MSPIQRPDEHDRPHDISNTLTPHIQHPIHPFSPTPLLKPNPQLNILNLLPTLIRRATELLPRTPRLLRSNRTAPADRGVRLFVIDEQLALLAVAPRHFVRDFDDGESAFEAVYGAEDIVHFFEGAAGRLGLWEDGISLVEIDGEVWLMWLVVGNAREGLRRRSTPRAQ